MLACRAGVEREGERRGKREDIGDGFMITLISVLISTYECSSNHRTNLFLTAQEMRLKNQVSS